MFKLTSKLLLALFFCCAYPAMAKEDPGLRYRAIIYLFPDAPLLNAPTEAGVPAGFELVKKLPEVAQEPRVALTLLEDFAEDYPVPDAEYLGYFGNGIDRDQVNAIQRAPQLLMADFAYPAADAVATLAPINEYLYRLSKQRNGLIWDSETRELFSPKAWREQRIESIQGDFPSIDRHIVIHAYHNGEGVRAISLGMARFGLPDLVVENFSWSLNDQVGNLINVSAQALFEGQRPTAEGRLHLDMDALQETALKQRLLASLQENATRQVDLQIAEGRWEEGDPDNWLLEIKFDFSPGDSLGEKQEALLAALFGWEDEVIFVQHDRLILEASMRAKQQLNSLRQAFNAGLDPGEFIMVKAPFVTDDGGTEWMWVEIRAWTDSDIRGLLKSEPRFIAELKGGMEVEVNQEEVFDYFRSYPDGRTEGNETGQLMLQAQQ